MAVVIGGGEGEGSQEGHIVRKERRGQEEKGKGVDRWGKGGSE